MKTLIRKVVAGGLLLSLPWSCMELEDHKEPPLCSAETLTRCATGWLSKTGNGSTGKACERLFFMPDGNYKLVDCTGDTPQTMQQGRWSLEGCRVRLVFGAGNLSFFEIRAATSNSLTLYILAGLASREEMYLCE
ncbi:hypothetical protein HNV11_13065 [Spirosoma taeanense]|uniref:Uncharacterized protein n=1 Tax=Spirosoma taeanense TaxID=2735870 RepID=A0A6M5YAD2_9BACT|nr:hypothetical protein [Spirosoma taeanense]QJW90240.1 hypothetical protein HNV11_13065 [Spirosoma taeanense]